VFSFCVYHLHKNVKTKSATWKDDKACYDLLVAAASSKDQRQLDTAMEAIATLGGQCE
jgi:hypothetical protein